MSLLDRVFAEPELREAPPVLVDVGAAGGIPAEWRRIARHAIGVGFEPDAREAAPLSEAQRAFQKWVFCPTVVTPVRPADGRATLHLTRSPQCSSTLRPRAAALRDWAFGEMFEVTSTREVPATTLHDALAAQNISRVDWLKCDTQGTDLRIFLSLPEAWRARAITVEFEPGLLDAYEGEDTFHEVMAAMAREPFWLAALDINRTPRVPVPAVASPDNARWVRRLAPGAPGWANVRYLRDVKRASAALDRRAHLLAWVFASMSGQPGYALAVAELGTERFGAGLFSELATASVRSLRWAMLRRAPGVLWRRLARR